MHCRCQVQHSASNTMTTIACPCGDIFLDLADSMVTLYSVGSVQHGFEPPSRQACQEIIGNSPKKPGVLRVLGVNYLAALANNTEEGDYLARLAGGS